MQDTELMPFGKHKGTMMQEVPDSYLIWLYGQDWLKTDQPAVHEYIVRNANVLGDLILADSDKK